MPDVSQDELLAGFTAPQPFTMKTAANAPGSPGVHVVLDRSLVIYVGWTGNLRRRLRQHLTGNRG
jgi:excinuclease UvrABC nuclease subunit